MATRNGAVALGRPSEFGTVEAGKRADLVILGADPVADIGNARRIEWVVQGGRMSRPAVFLPPRLRRE
jgi:imidazolonepropionase-like amidohydrolase